MIIRRATTLFRLGTSILLAAAAWPLAAAPPPTRPVSVGVVANYEHNLARSANLGWTRMDISWKEIQPTPSAWNIGPTNDRVNVARANGQQVLAILHNVPAWLTPNINIPPYTTTEWSAFVRRLAQEFRGRIAAYEIWNEPDQKKTNKDGIGWGRNIEEPPLFIDFVRAAAIEIRAQAPGTLVVAPAFQSRNDADGADNRKRRILQQAQSAVYPNGPGTSFIDVISVHNNAGDVESAKVMGTRLNSENLAYFWNHAPSLRPKPVWVTEYGWRSNAVQESGQRQRTCEVTETYTGFLYPQNTHLNDWDVRRAFLFTLKDPSISNTLFRGDSSAKPVVTQYLRSLPYPAVQNPSASPSCSGSGLAEAGTTTVAALGAELASLGLHEPGGAIPSGFGMLSAERTSDGLGTELLYGDAAGGVLSIVVSAAPAEGKPDSFLTEAGAEWTAGALRISVSGMRGGLPIGKGAVSAVATALDPSFPEACLLESVTSDPMSAQRFGYSPPSPPAGFAQTAAQLEYTAPTKGCDVGDASDSAILDFTWTFEDATGQVVRAGIYRYDAGFEGTQTTRRSLHWGGKGGTRYWVAADPSVVAPNQEALRAIAASMDPDFGL